MTFSPRVRVYACLLYYDIAMAVRLCRLCGTTVLSFKHAVSLFSSMAVKQQLPSRIENLLDVKIAGNDGLPQHICEKCKRRVETLERADQLERTTPI